MNMLQIRLEGNRLWIDPPGLEIGPIDPPTDIAPISRLIRRWETRQGLARLLKYDDPGRWWTVHRYKFARELAIVVNMVESLAPVIRRLPEQPDQIAVEGEAEVSVVVANALSIIIPAAVVATRTIAARNDSKLQTARFALALMRRNHTATRMAKLTRRKRGLRVVMLQTEVQ